MANNDGNLIVGLDIPKSVSQINADIKKLENQLAQVKATGALDTSATVKQINAQISALQSQLKTIEVKTNIDPKALQSVQKAEKQVVNSQEQAYKNAQKELKKLYDLRIEYAKIDNPNNNQKYLYENAIKEQEKAWRKAYSNTSEPENWNVQKRLELQRQEVAMQEKLAQAYNKVENAKKQTNNVSQIQLSTDITKIENDYKRFGIVSQEVENNLKELKIARENALKAEGTDNASAEIEKYNQKLAETKSSWKELQSTQVSVNQRTSQMTEMQEWMRKNQRATKLCGDQVQKLIQECRTCDKVRFDQIKNEFKKLQVEAGKAGKLGNTLFGGIIEEGKKFIQWTGVTGIIMGVSNNVRQAVNELKDLDDILTEISKTSDLTSSQLKELGESAFDSASKYGRTASDYLTGVQEMYRAGFDNAEQMAELSVLAQAAGDMESNSANDYLMATNAAYDYKGSVEELNKVLDSQNYITNNAAVSMQDMADATSEAASIASQYGVEIDQLSAMIAVVASKTRETGSEVGTALRSIFVTLQDTTSKPVVEAFNSVGISMTKFVDGIEKLKTPIELLQELSVAFNELPEGAIERSTILTDIGKKYHANTLSAILSDWSSYEDMLELYSQGMGSAAKEAEKSANNWSGSWNKVKNSWTDLVQNFANTDVIIDAINALNGLIQAVDKLGAVGTIGLAGGLFAGWKNVGEGKTHPSIVLNSQQQYVFFGIPKFSYCQ